MPTPFTVSFVYCEHTRKWDVFVHGATTELEARQGFNAVLITASQATPELAYNRAELQPDGSYKISVGKLPVNQNLTQN
jgi:hypothetical protein